MKKKKLTRKQREKRGRILALAGVLAGLALVGGFLIWLNQNPKSEELSATQTAQQTPAPTAANEPEPVAADAADEETVLPSLQPFLDANPDTVGYIRVPNTEVDYPVVNSGDNEFYMTRGFDRQPAEEGAIFMDFRCDINDFNKTRNIILYGHRMKDGTMFKSLTNYQDKAFFDDNRTIRFDTLYHEYEWEVFAVFVTHIDFYYIDTEFPTDEKWLDFLDTCREKSMFEADTVLYPTDIVLTLSTCAINKNKRLVVMAKLMH